MTNETELIRKSALAPTILVAGGAGFIGSHLVEALLLKNARVVVVDNFSTGKKEFLQASLDNPKMVLIEADINDGIPNNIESVDYIFHLAGTESHIYSDEKISLESLLTSAVGTRNLLDLARKCAAKFLLASSTDVYSGLISSYDINFYFGQSEVEEKKFSHAEAKRFAEALVSEYHKKHKVDARVVRLPDVYGPRMAFDSGSEVGRLLKELLQGNDLTVAGDGLEKNYYLYISDAIAGLVKAEFSEDTDGKIFTLASSEVTTTLELTYLVKSLANSPRQVVFKNPKGTQKTKETKLPECTNCSDIKWASKILLREGLTKTLKWNGYQFNKNTFKPMKFLAKEEQPSPNSITSMAPELAGINFPSPGMQKRKLSIPLPHFTTPNIKLPRIKVPSMPAIQVWKNQPQTFLPLIGSGLSLTIALLFFAVIPIIQVATYSNSGYQKLKEAQASAETLNLETAQTKGTEAAAEFNKANIRLNGIAWMFMLVKQEARLRTYAKALRIAQYSASALTNTAIAGKPLTELWDEIKPDSTTTIDQNTIAQADLNFKSAKDDLARAQAELKDLEPKYLPGFAVSKIEDTSKKINQAEEYITIAQSATEALPEILGVDGKRRYLILFQNPNELRATGGFIGSYAIVNLENGKIKEIAIDDIYNVDGLLDLAKDKTPTYGPIAELVKQRYLRIRDANWQASFPDSATTIAQLFDKANGTRFNGVVAIDIYLVKNMLKATGPVFLTAYNEEINADNVYERAQFHAEALYTDGSQQKRAFLTVLGSKLLETLFSTDNNKLANLAKAGFESLDQKHVLVYLPNTQLSALMAKKGWDGQVNKTKTDYLYVVDSNLGSNKANYFVRQSAVYEIKNAYRDGSLEVVLKLDYEHTGKDNTWPGGPYTDYLRVLVPDESFLHKATLQSSSLPLTDITNKTFVGSEAGRRTFETSFKIAPGEKAEITFNYTLPPAISLSKSQSMYSLVWQKQPGTEAMPIQIILNKPFGRTLVQSTPAMQTEGETYTYTGDLMKDFKLMLQIN